MSNELLLGGKEVKTFLYWFPARDNTPLSLSFITFNDHLRVTLYTDQAVIPDPHNITGQCFEPTYGCFSGLYSGSSQIPISFILSLFICLLVSSSDDIYEQLEVITDLLSNRRIPGEIRFCREALGVKAALGAMEDDFSLLEPLTMEEVNVCERSSVEGGGWFPSIERGDCLLVVRGLGGRWVVRMKYWVESLQKEV